jgi:hypothetical protein
MRISDLNQQWPQPRRLTHSQGNGWLIADRKPPLAGFAHQACRFKAGVSQNKVTIKRTPDTNRRAVGGHRRSRTLVRSG